MQSRLCCAPHAVRSVGKVTGLRGFAGVRGCRCLVGTLSQHPSLGRGPQGSGFLAGTPATGIGACRSCAVFVLPFCPTVQGAQLSLAETGSATVAPALYALCRQGRFCYPGFQINNVLCAGRFPEPSGYACPLWAKHDMLQPLGIVQARSCWRACFSKSSI